MDAKFEKLSDVLCVTVGRDTIQFTEEWRTLLQKADSNSDAMVILRKEISTVIEKKLKRLLFEDDNAKAIIAAARQE